MYWPKLSRNQIKQEVSRALALNTNYRQRPVMGIPATYLDAEIFYPDAPFLEEAPFLSTLVANPNHIGCHTLHSAEKIFAGTQALERSLVKICAEEIFRGERDMQDGYVASGGTEGNIEALWIYRNYFRDECGALPGEVAVVFSEDSHYSITKGTDLLGLKALKIPVDRLSRQMDPGVLEHTLRLSVEQGVKYFIAVLNMSTTMFGSVDDIDVVTQCLHRINVPFRLHVDAAFGGFIYPFANPQSMYGFHHPHITSISIDGHKLLQTPYGTGIFLVRKNYLKYVRTSDARYVPGTDHTLCGSRSGANAVAVWMVLHNYGSEGWKQKTALLLETTGLICQRLRQLDIRFYRNPHMNIITIPASDISEKIAAEFCLVADSYERKPEWWKIVVMPHITGPVIESFFAALEKNNSSPCKPS